MPDDIDATFLVRMAATPVHWMPADWVPSGPILGPLLELADLPLCAAPDPDASRALEALGARLPVARTPQECWPASIGFLVLREPGEFSDEWRRVLAPGALVVTRNAEHAVIREDGVVSVLLDLEAGVSLDLCAGGHAKALRAFLENCVHGPQLAAAVVQMALALQGKNAHLMMAAKAAGLPRDGAAVPAAPTDVPLFRGAQAPSQSRTTSRPRRMGYLGPYGSDD
jgi:hypothetical protein